MFTGIVEDLGRVSATSPLDAGTRLTIESAVVCGDLSLGESVAVNGACMTVVAWTATTFDVDVSAESLRRTTLGGLGVGDRVNLERAMRLSDRIGGHLVSGHIDGTGRVAGVRTEGESSVYTFAIPRALARCTIEKGSIAVDGISLTCFNCVRDSVDVAVIPHTLRVTTLADREVGDAVNIENDLLGKYVARLIEPLTVR
jgi:riboflavin synthase